MWLFEATYINMDTDTERKLPIEFDGQFFDKEIECYMYAMDRAIGNRKENELFSNLQFIAN